MANLHIEQIDKGTTSIYLEPYVNVPYSVINDMTHMHGGSPLILNDFEAVKFKVSTNPYCINARLNTRCFKQEVIERKQRILGYVESQQSRLNSFHYTTATMKSTSSLTMFDACSMVTCHVSRCYIWIECVVLCTIYSM